MRYVIAVLLFFYCYSPSLYAEKAKNDIAIQKLDKTFSNFSKKQKNSLKTELFSGQVDLLHQSSQSHSLVAVHFVKFLQGSAISLVKISFNNALSTKFYYHFIFQYLYPKHSFW